MIPTNLLAHLTSFVCASLLSLMVPSHPSDCVSEGPDSETSGSMLDFEEREALRLAVELERCRVHESEGGHYARNARLGWNLEFTGGGLRVESARSDVAFALSFEGHGRAGTPLRRSALLATTVLENRLEYGWGDQLTEWYTNDPRGLAHGFTLNERPAAAEGNGVDSVHLVMRVSGSANPEVVPGRRSIRFVDRAGAELQRYADLLVVDANGAEVPAHFELHELGFSIVVEDRDATYPIVIDPFVRTAYLKSPDPEIQDLLGPIDIYDDRIVVGVPDEDGGSAGVGGDPFDNSLGRSGAAFVFFNGDDGWELEAYLKPLHPSGGDRFGKSVAIWGDTIAVGAPNESSAPGAGQTDESLSSSGAVFIFDRAGGQWTQTGFVKASNADASDAFGLVDLHEDTLVVGAPNERSHATGVNGDELDNSVYVAGAGYVFRRQGSNWIQEAYIKPLESEYDENFGQSVAVCGDLVAFGNHTEDSDARGIDGDATNENAPLAGAVFVYARTGTQWAFDAYIKSGFSDGGDLFGTSVALSGQMLIVGSPGEDGADAGTAGDPSDNSSSRVGAAFVFERVGGIWMETAYLKASNPEERDNFGNAVDLHNGLAVVGAEDEWSDSDYVDGDQSDNLQPGAGAAYVFSRTAGLWSQAAYLKAPASDFTDAFGERVAIYGRTAVVSTSTEDGGQGGVNADPTDNSADRAGAAYAFEWISSPAELVCAGDGVLAACPCGNERPIGSREGCANTTGFGARIEATGSPRVVNDNLVIHITGAPEIFVNGMLLRGTALAPQPFRDGVLCVGGETDRMEVLFFDGDGSASSSQSIASEAAPGEVLYYQCWYRDPGSSPCSTGSNLTAALRVNWN